MSDLLSQASLVMIPSGYKEDVVYSQIPTSGAGDLSFTRASNGTRVNSAGLVEVSPWNLVQYSEDFAQAPPIWNKYQATITSNTTTAPNGTLTADSITDNFANDVHIAYQDRAGMVAGTYTISVYAKASTLSHINLQWYDGTTFYTSNAFNLSNGTTTGANQSIESVGNGWYRCSFTFTTTVSGTQYAYVMLNNGTSNSYTGTGSGAVYIWGYQLNIGATAKPYFPTTDRLNVPRLTYQNGGGGCPSLLLEKQSTNLCLYSEDFTNGAWSLDGDGVGQSVTANYSISPDGTQNADRLQLNKTGGTYSRIKQSVAGIGVYTFSVYMKSNTSSTQNVGLRIEGFGINCAVTTTWQRFSVTTTTIASVLPQILLFDSITGNDETADISIWGAQVEAGSYATSYIVSTSSSATRVADACFKTGISSLIGQTEGTIYGHFNVLAAPSESQSIWLRSSSGGLYGDIIFILTNNAQQARAEVGAGGATQFSYTGSSGLSLGWHKFALAYKQNDFAFYIDGVQMATDNSGIVPTCDEMYLGYYVDGGTRQTSQKEAILFPTRLTNAELASLTTI